MANEPLIPDADPVVNDSAPEPVAPAPAAPSADQDLWEVKVGGKASKVHRDEVIAGYQRQQDYTRKTMEIAEERKRLQDQVARATQYEQEREQLKRFLQDEAQVAAYLQHLRGAAVKPDETLTAQTAQQMIASQMQRQQAALEERMQVMTQELETRQLAAQYATEIDSAINAALKEFPELTNIRRIHQVLREEVAERQPSTLDEAKALFGQVAREQAEQIRAFLTAQKKQDAVQASKLQNGIEPPGGTGVQPKPRPTFKFGDPRLLDDLVKELTESGGDR